MTKLILLIFLTFSAIDIAAGQNRPPDPHRWIPGEREPLLGLNAAYKIAVAALPKTDIPNRNWFLDSVRLSPWQAKMAGSPFWTDYFFIFRRTANRYGEMVPPWQECTVTVDNADGTHVSVSGTTIADIPIAALAADREKPNPHSWVPGKGEPSLSLDAAYKIAMAALAKTDFLNQSHLNSVRLSLSQAKMTDSTLWANYSFVFGSNYNPYAENRQECIVTVDNVDGTVVSVSAIKSYPK